ncbi:MAG: hypothetical protein ACRDD7_05810, partial [Peptostreptococcaceae bacterium]
MLESSVFWDVANSILLLVEVSMLFFVLDEFGNRKKNAKKIYVSIIIMYAIIHIMRVYDTHIEYHSIVSLLLYIVFYKIDYEINWSKAFIVPATYVMLGTAFDLVGVTIVKLFNNIDNIDVILSHGVYRLEGIMISKLLLVILFILIKYFKTSNTIRKKDFIYIGMPILVNIFSMFYMLKYEMLLNQEYSVSTNMPILMSLLLCLSSISLVLVVFKIAQNNKIEIENAL